MKKSEARLILSCFLFLPAILTACTAQRMVSNAGARNAPSVENSVAGRDIHTDTSLGALPKNQKSEAGQEADELVRRDETSHALGEFRGKEIQEELQQVHRSIVDFDKTEDQVRQQQ